MEKIGRKFLNKYKNTNRKCAACGSPTIVKTSQLKDGMTYDYYGCQKCGEEFLDMTQLHKLSERYRDYRKHSAKLSRWGVSLGVRIPKELVEKYNLKEKTEITLIPEENGIRMILQA